MNFYTKLLDYNIGNLNKFFLATHLFIILFIMGIMQASATSYGQNITISQKNISVKSVFKAIKLQTGYDVLWRPDKVDVNYKINAEFDSTPLEKVMQKCLEGKEFIFEIQDRSIVLKKKNSVVLFPLLQDSTVFKGKITDENGKSMAGVTVKVIGSKKTTFTSSSGVFSIYAPKRGTLEFTYIGYLSQQVTLSNQINSGLINVKMTPGNNNLGEVNIVSNGYQEIAKERATGSFEVITKEQLQHSSDPNLIKRLQGITTSLDFRNDLNPINSATTISSRTANSLLVSSSLANVTIRGKNSLNLTNTDLNQQSGVPLVVIDGVATPYSIDNVNPNDVENITILKDAAAASIWGARAANGVIVITTKRGGFDRPMSIAFNSNFNITDKLDLFYKKTMSTSDYIDAQAYLFNASNTSIGLPTVNQAQQFISPVAEILGAQKRGEISASQANSQLDLLRGNDVRRDFEKYIIKNAFVQSYSLSIDGGSKKVYYRISAGYDNTKNNSVASSSTRLVLNYNVTFKPIKNLEINTGVVFSQRKGYDPSYDGPGFATSNPYFLYTRLVNDQGNPISIPYKYQPSFVNLLSSTYGNKIQDLSFTPLNDISAGYSKTRANDLNFLVNANYRLNDIFSANIVYNYNRNGIYGKLLDSQSSFFMRDLITTYTTTAGVQQIPLGGRLITNDTGSDYQSLRGQLNIDKKWGEKHVLNAIAGTEFTDSYILIKPAFYYGYNDDKLTSNNQLNYSQNLPLLFINSFGSNQARIPYFGTTFSDTKGRTSSLFANAAYTYNRRYTVSGSIRRDLSSYFGVGTNKGGTPFYSFGGSWNIANEDFYRISWLPRLQLRTTFGYNGNVNNRVSARPIITYGTSAQDNGLLSATTGTDATNNQLRPERTSVLNFGLDFGLKNNRLSGSIDFYDKRTRDLIAQNVVDPSVGYNRLTYNTAGLHGRGADLALNSQNLQFGFFSWGSNFLFSYNRVKVANLFSPAANTEDQVVVGSPSYNEGADLSRLYAFRWAGLDHSTGTPMGYANGQPIVVNSSATYNAVTSQSSSYARYFGSAVPVYYGSLRNTFRYGLFSVSANLLFKLGYYFRRPTSDVVNYSQLFGSTIQAVQGAEYSKRWQRLGDELTTNVPSAIYPANNLRDLFYQYADINVQKADHVRLQEINLSYSLGKKNWFIKNPRIYTNITNLGIVWRANKLGLDPDINDYPNPRTYAFGFSANF